MQISNSMIWVVFKFKLETTQEGCSILIRSCVGPLHRDWRKWSWSAIAFSGFLMSGCNFLFFYLQNKQSPSQQYIFRKIKVESSFSFAIYSRY